VSSSRERVRGFKSALLEANIPFDDTNVVACDYKIEDGKRGAKALLRKGDRPTAIFCCNDMLAIGVLQAAKDEGLQVPGDLSVIGFDNTILSNVVNPPITTVAQPMEYMAKLVFELIVSNLENDLAPKKRIVLRPELIVRESTASVEKDFRLVP